MKPTKFAVAAAGLLGIIAVFLPYISAEGMSASLWDFTKIPDPMGTQGLLNGPKQAYVAIACFAIPLVVGGMAIAKGRMVRWQGIVAAVFSLAALAVEGVRKGLTGEEGVGTAIGGKILFLAAIVGLVGGIVAAAKPEPEA